MFKLAIITTILSAVSSLAYADFHVGNGGNTVECVQGSQSTFVGIYALDYLATYSQRTQNSDIRPVTDWRESLKKTAELLNSKYPVLGISFRGYLADLENYNDLTKPHRWIEAPFGVYDVNDSALINRIPANCGKVNPDGSLKVTQTVVRVQKENATEYHVSRTEFDRLKNEMPLQFSFLIIHEWAWDWSGDPESIRQFVRFLHSDSAELASPSEFVTIAQRLGIPGPTNRPNYTPFATAAMRAMNFRRDVDRLHKPIYSKQVSANAWIVDDLLGDLMTRQMDGASLSELKPRFAKIQRVLTTLKRQFYYAQAEAPDPESESSWMPLLTAFNRLEMLFNSVTIQ